MDFIALTVAESAAPPTARSARVVVAPALAFIVSFGTGVAHAIDIPKRKSGLWEMTITSSRGDGARTMSSASIGRPTMSQVRKDRAPASGGTVRQARHPQGWRQDGVDTVCKRGGMTITTHALVSGSFDSGYRMDSTSTYDPPMRGMTESRTTVEAKWFGPCKPDQKPGDMIVPGMGKFNAQDLRERMQQMPKPQ